MLTAVLLWLWGTSVIGAMTLAMAKDRHPVAWLGAALLCGPVAMFVLLRLPATGHYAALRIDPEAMELCETCCEPVRIDRDRCRHCGSVRSAT
ncbi:hypothetical protein [Rhizorhabdus argentea]|uniref:hypothetical protein n=1 Tax=Rhizorhabdus argentea TaxID=1387174 RepID=UPI0030EE9DB1